MVVVDKHGLEIEIGSYVIYTRVGTVGEVLDTKTDEDGISWVLIQYDDLTKLWYNTRNIELTDKKYLKNNSMDKDTSVEDLHEQINRTLGSEMSEDAVGGG